MHILLIIIFSSLVTTITTTAAATNATTASANNNTKLSPIPDDNLTKVNHEYDRDKILYGMNDPRTDEALAKVDVIMCVNSFVYNVTGKWDWPLGPCDDSMTRHISEHVFDKDAPIFRTLTLEFLKARGIL